MPYLADDTGGSPASTPASTNLISQIAAANGIPLGGGGFGAADQPLYVYAGRESVDRGGLFPARMDVPGVRRDRVPVPVDVLQQRFAQSGDKNIKRMALALALAGFAGVSLDDAANAVKDASLDEVLDWHRKFLEGAGEEYTLYHRNITPEKYLRRRLEYRLGKKWDGKTDSLNKILDGLDSGASQLKNGEFTTTETSRDFLSPKDAKVMIRDLLQQELGRDPTRAEYEDFLSAANTIQEENPLKRTTTDTYKEGELVNSDSTTTGGISPTGVQQGLLEELKKQPSWAEWQAVGNYAPALFAALGTPVSGV